MGKATDTITEGKWERIHKEKEKRGKMMIYRRKEELRHHFQQAVKMKENS